MNKRLLVIHLTELHLLPKLATEHFALAILSDLDAAATEKQLRSMDLPLPAPDIIYLEADAALAAMADQLLNYLSEGAHGRLQSIFCFSQNPQHMAMAHVVRQHLQRQGSHCPVVAIGWRQHAHDVMLLEQQGAMFVAANAAEAVALLTSTRFELRLSLVVMAYNEADTILTTINDIQQFADLYLSNYEILVVDDGSQDQTAALVKNLALKNLRLLQHPHNLGMGAAMRTGYSNASMDYIVALPADRQVRTHSLIQFLPHCKTDHVVLSRYLTYHTSITRAVMSWVFRLCLKWIGGLHIDFAGAYIFSRSWLKSIDLQSLHAHSFVFSFELLQALANAQAKFYYVAIHPFLRDHGSSRVVGWQRIAKICGELWHLRRQRH